MGKSPVNGPFSIAILGLEVYQVSDCPIPSACPTEVARLREKLSEAEQTLGAPGVAEPWRCEKNTSLMI